MGIPTYSIEFSKKYPTIDLSEYFNFIESVRLPVKIKFRTANHHVLPKWAFPEFGKFNNFNWNSAILFHSDHLAAHVLLAKLWPKHENLVTPKIMGGWDADSYQSLKSNLAKSQSELMKSRVISESEMERLRNMPKMFWEYCRSNGISHPTETKEAKERASAREFDKVDKGTHPWQKDENGESNASRRAKLGLMPSQTTPKEILSTRQTTRMNAIVAEGKHWAKTTQFRENQRERALQRVAAGVHQFQGGKTVVAVNKDGVGARIPIELYNASKNSGLPEVDWEYVYGRSKEAARRKLLHATKHSETVGN